MSLAYKQRPLLFRMQGKTSLTGVSASAFHPHQTLAEGTHEIGRCHAFQNEDYAHSMPSRLLARSDATAIAGGGGVCVLFLVF